MAYELAFTSNYTGASVAAWESGAWTARGTITSQTFINPGVSGTYAQGAGYVLPLSAINVNPERDFMVEASMTVGTTYYMGPGIFDATGAGAFAGWWNSPVGALVLSTSSYFYNSATFVNGGGTPVYPSRLRIEKIGTQYRVSYSTDNGASWSTPSAFITANTTALSQVGVVMGNVGTPSFTHNQFKVYRLTLASAPAAPSGFGAVALTTSADISWVNIGDADYWEYRINGGSTVTSPNGYLPNVLVSGLSTTTSYTIEVRGVNSAGTGAWSTPFNFTTQTAVYYDNFNRADSTSSPGTPVSGGPYTTVSGVWGINGNRLYTSTSVSAAKLTFPGSYNFDLQFTMPVIIGGTSQGMMFRYTDVNNFWLVYYNNGATWLYRVTAGVGVNFMNLNHTTLVGTDQVRIIGIGRQISVYINGIRKGQVEDMFSNTASTMGYFNENTGTRWDNVYVTNLVVDPSAPGANGNVVDDMFNATATTLTTGEINDQQIPATGGFDTHVVKGRTFHIDDEGEVP